MKILALDLGTTTGWASEAGGILTSGTICFSGRPKDHKGEKFRRFRAWLRDLIDKEKPEIVFYEDVKRHAGVLAAHAYGGYLGHVLAVLASRGGIPIRGIGVSTIKKKATGRGNADKMAMVKAAINRWPDQDILDDNQADALWILETSKNL